MSTVALALAGEQRGGGRRRTVFTSLTTLTTFINPPTSSSAYFLIPISLIPATFSVPHPVTDLI